jgi:hypothetical protein
MCIASRSVLIFFKISSQDEIHKHYLIIIFVTIIIVGNFTNLDRISKVHNNTKSLFLIFQAISHFQLIDQPLFFTRNSPYCNTTPRDIYQYFISTQVLVLSLITAARGGRSGGVREWSGVGGVNKNKRTVDSQYYRDSPVIALLRCGRRN